MAPKRTVYINLIERDRGREKKLAFLSLSLLAGLILLCSLAGIYFYTRTKVEMERNRGIILRDRIQDLDKEDLASSAWKVLPEQFAKKAERVRQIEVKMVSYAEVVGAIEKSMPGGVILSSIEVDEKQVNLKGFAQDYNELVRLIAGLRTNPIIANVSLASSQVDQKSNEIEFQLRVEWKAVKQ